LFGITAEEKEIKIEEKMIRKGFNNRVRACYYIFTDSLIIIIMKELTNKSQEGKEKENDKRKNVIKERNTKRMSEKINWRINIVLL
jgi:hypothetical protein